MSSFGLKRWMQASGSLATVALVCGSLSGEAGQPCNAARQGRVMHRSAAVYHTVSNPVHVVASTAVHTVNPVAVAPVVVAAAEKDIVETAIGAGTFKTLAAALTAADLVKVLQGEGPFTVFAPTDEAFKKLPAGTVEDLLKPENKDKLVAVLTYHVVAGKVMAADVVKLKSAKTVQGTEVKITVKDGKVMVDQANVVKTDIGCKNGVIHVIDQVILPK